MGEEYRYTAAISRRKDTSYNIHVKLDVMCHKKRGTHVIEIACATQIPDMMIHTTLKRQRKLKQRNYSKVKIACQRCNVLEVFEWCLAT
jgi:hypothetical protein